MSDDNRDDDIFRVDTVPPPAGESDAYSAPTRVGPLAAAVVEEMMVASVRKAEVLTRAAEAKAAASLKKGAEEAKAAEAAKTTARPGPMVSAEKNKPSATPVKGVVEAEALSDSDLISELTAPTSDSRREGPPRAVSSGNPPPVPQKAPPMVPPRMYDEADEFDNAATLLGRAAQAPAVQPVVIVRRQGTAPAAPVSASSPQGSPGTPMFASAVTVFLPLAVGFAIFAIGLALYFWVR